MISKLRYASEKFTSAVRLLAVGKRDVRQRLQNAYLEFHTVRPEDLPPHLAEEYRQICAEMTKYDPEFPREGRLQATLRRIQNGTGAKIAKRICALHEQIEMTIANCDDHP